MGDLIRVPFLSYQRLNKWFNESAQDETCLQYYDGMRKWFATNGTSEIRLFDYGEGNSPTVDVQMQFETEDGPDQIYLMTLASPSAQETGSIYLNDMTAPFHPDGTICWPRGGKLLTEDDVVEAVGAWSKMWWPDFVCTYIFESISDHTEEFVDADEIDNEAFVYRCSVLLKYKEGMKAWGLQRGCISVDIKDREISLIGLPTMYLEELEKTWPGMLKYTSFDLIF